MDQQAAATYFVLYRLTQQGFTASPTTNAQAELVACSSDGRRVVLVRVRARARGDRFRMTFADTRLPGRNVAYVFVDFDVPGSSEPHAFVMRGSLVAARVSVDPSWPRDERAFAPFDGCFEGWHALGLDRAAPSRSPAAVSSSPTLS